MVCDSLPPAWGIQVDWDYLELLPAHTLVALGHETLSVVSKTDKRMGRKEILYWVVAKWPNTKSSGSAFPTWCLPDRSDNTFQYPQPIWRLWEV